MGEKWSKYRRSPSLVHILDVIDVALVELVCSDKLPLGFPLILILNLHEFLSAFN